MKKSYSKIRIALFLYKQQIECCDYFLIYADTKPALRPEP